MFFSHLMYFLTSHSLTPSSLLQSPEPVIQLHSTTACHLFIFLSLKFFLFHLHAYMLYSLYTWERKKTKKQPHALTLTHSRYSGSAMNDHTRTNRHTQCSCVHLSHCVDQLEKSEATKSRRAFFPLKDCINLSTDVSI